MNDLFQNKLSEIISVALSQDQLNGVETILKMLCDAVDACGCILWESEPFSKFQNEPPIGNLYVFAKWFQIGEKEKIPLFRIPIQGSANGYALINHAKVDNKWIVNGVMSIRDAREKDAPTHKENYLVKKLNVTSICIVPICFDCENNKKNASLAIYRNEEINEFTDEEQKFIKTIAELVPQLYEAICDKVGKRLLEEANKILDRIDISDRTEDSNKPSAKVQIQLAKDSLTDFCKMVAENFQCVETSLFFDRSYKNFELTHSNQKKYKVGEKYSLFATNYQEWTEAKTEYSLKKEDGLTAWVLAEMKTKTIFNLATFHQDKKNELYVAEECWSDSLKFGSENFKRILREMLNLPSDSELKNDEDVPPLSFMAVPIFRDTKLLGVIRCCTAKDNPWIFPKRHSSILEKVAILISRFWSNFVLHLEEIEESESWKKLIQKINAQNNKIQGNIDRLDFNKDLVYKEILDITQKTFDKQDILDIRLYNNNKELYFAKTLGDSWEKQGSKIEREARKNKTFSKTDSKKIFAFDVIETGDVEFIKNVKEKYGKDTETFPDTQQIIIAPIGVAKENIGVLDIRRTTDNPFPSNAPIMAELIGRQLGLYLELWETEKQQRQVFEDTWHQLKGPVRYNFARATTLINHECFYDEPYEIDEDTAKEISDELFSFRGLARKSKKVLENAGMFAELATKGQLKQIIGGTKLTKDDLSKMCYEIAEDTKLMLDDYRNIRFYRHFETFKKLDNVTVKVKVDYLEQALNCLIDNAGKYSYTETSVQIYCGEEYQGKRYFYIAVENQGLEITASEIKKLLQRKTRGESAKFTTGEGSGIGLWITDNIMKAHGGKLTITPTNLSGKTVVKLLFPISN